jgi:hypothetical protein
MTPPPISKSAELTNGPSMSIITLRLRPTCDAAEVLRLLAHEARHVRAQREPDQVSPVTTGELFPHINPLLYCLVLHCVVLSTMFRPFNECNYGAWPSVPQDSGIP